MEYNKDDVAESGLFKIDILSNRGLSQLFDVNKQEIKDAFILRCINLR